MLKNKKKGILTKELPFYVYLAVKARTLLRVIFFFSSKHKPKDITMDVFQARSQALRRKKLQFRQPEEIMQV
jgi:hypothetical protein